MKEECTKLEVKKKYCWIFIFEKDDSYKLLIKCSKLEE